jgi:hypothetical protein
MMRVRRLDVNLLRRIGSVSHVVPLRTMRYSLAHNRHRRRIG